jgi:hypothetical protein
MVQAILFLIRVMTVQQRQIMTVQHVTLEIRLSHLFQTLLL